ncbi:hypothetical protein GGI43DRAFT_431636 [Trichoderma evansii]
MPPRKGSSKVKTGCRTCKARKIKCDEAKPNCRRCASTGRTCSGYDDSASSTLTWYRPRQLTAHDEQEGRAFQFFSRVVGPALSGTMDGYFWTHLVLQFSHFTPAVRHAVVAISALYEDFQNGSRIMRLRDGNLFALKHYNAAIRDVKSTQDDQLILLMCILFMCVECLQGDFEGSVRHSQHGALILDKFGCLPWARNYLLPIFRRLAHSPFMMGAKLPPGPSLAGFDAALPDRFETLAQAQILLDMIVTKVGRYESGHNEDSRESLELRLGEWRQRMADFESSGQCSDISSQLALVNIKARCERAKMSLDMRQLITETDFDQNLEHFRSIVDLASRAAQLRSFLANDLLQPVFTFEVGFLSVLFFVASKCRHLETRLKALSLMPLACVAKESLFDVGTLYRVARRIIEIEHGISLDDEKMSSTIQSHDTTIWPPESRRVKGAPIDHEIETILGEDGTATYRRTVWFLMRKDNGEVVRKKEYLTDQWPRNSVLNVPDMRCARPRGFGGGEANKTLEIRFISEYGD